MQDSWTLRSDKKELFNEGEKYPKYQHLVFEKVTTNVRFICFSQTCKRGNVETFEPR